MEQEVLAGLIARGIPEHIAKGMVANMIAESGLNPGINEANPTVAGSRGGYGLNQWTGPRRRQFEAFAADRGLAPSDVNAQLDFTVWELGNTEKGAWNALQGAKDPVEAARLYSETFLRPGIPHMDARLREAGRLAGTPYAPQQGNMLAMAPQAPQGAPQGPQSVPMPPQNALQSPDWWKSAEVNAAAFQQPVNQLAQVNRFRGYYG